MLCAEGITNLNIIQREAFTEECGCVMIQAVSRRPLTEKAHVRLRANQCEICVGKNGIDTGVSSITLVSTSPYDSINAPYSCLFVSYCHQDIRVKPGKIRNAMHLGKWKNIHKNIVSRKPRSGTGG